ncbi:MAG: dTMP kinase [Bifidobacterium sp.]|jgi:dTMP kinase|nr:dTMP kinase [Bifidobacterium sp.]MCH4174798.1 dTMP kinase [Bifidobacterium sp.]
MAGLFISFEGVDGVGKTTQVNRLRAYALSQGQHPLLTREPGGTPVGLAIRELVLHGIAAFPSFAVAGGSDVVDESEDLSPRTEALLYAADRAQHVSQMIRPALERDELVISDRYVDSSLAYQAGGRELTIDDVRALSAWATGGLMPRRTYLLDMDPALSHARLQHQLDRLEVEGDAFQQRTRQEFLKLAEAEPERFLVLDASQTVDDVWQTIQHDFDKLLQELRSREHAEEGL